MLVGYGQLACGADILIAEALLDRGGELHVVLPFAEEDSSSLQLPWAERNGFRAMKRRVTRQAR